MLDRLMPPSRARLLGFLLMNPAGDFYLREIARLTGLQLYSVQRELALLEEIGLVSRTRRGRQVFFRVRTEHPLFPELRALVVKTVGLVIPLRAALLKAGGVFAAAVFGSVAAGTDTGASDVDLLVVGEVDGVRLHEAVAEVEGQTGRQVNYVEMTVPELRSRRATHDPFLERVLAGVLLPVVGELDAV